MATWRVPSIQFAVTPSGNGYYLQFEIAGLPESFVVKMTGQNASTLVFRVWNPSPPPGRWEDLHKSIVGWRFDSGLRRVFKRNRDATELPRSGRIIGAQRQADGTWIVRVFIGLTDLAQIAMGAPFRTLGNTSDLVPLYIQEIRRVTIGTAEHAFLRIVDASGLNHPDELSPTMTFTTSSVAAANLAVAGMNLGPSAFGVGSFPGYNRNCSPEGGKPRLQFHWDSQSERCWMFSQNAVPSAPPAIPILHDIRLNSTNMAAAASPSDACRCSRHGSLAHGGSTHHPAPHFRLTT